MTSASCVLRVTQLSDPEGKGFKDYKDLWSRDRRSSANGYATKELTKSGHSSALYYYLTGGTRCLQTHCV